MVPQPVHAVLLLFPISEESERARNEGRNLWKYIGLSE